MPDVPDTYRWPWPWPLRWPGEKVRCVGARVAFLHKGSVVFGILPVVVVVVAAVVMVYHRALRREMQEVKEL